MANPDIPAALVVLQTHLAAAAATLTDAPFDVDRGLPTGDRQLRYYWGGEVEPTHMGGNHVLNAELVGQRFIVAALWALENLSVDLVSVIDVEMQLLAGQIRTRIDGDSTLGGNVTDLELTFAEPDIVLISNARYVALRWNLDLSYVEYPIVP